MVNMLIAIISDAYLDTQMEIDAKMKTEGDRALETGLAGRRAVEQKGHALIHSFIYFSRGGQSRTTPIIKEGGYLLMESE